MSLTRIFSHALKKNCIITLSAMIKLLKCIMKSKRKLVYSNFFYSVYLHFLFFDLLHLADIYIFSSHFFPCHSVQIQYTKPWLAFLSILSIYLFPVCFLVSLRPFLIRRKTSRCWYFNIKNDLVETGNSCFFFFIFPFTFFFIMCLNPTCRQILFEFN